MAGPILLTLALLVLGLVLARAREEARTRVMTDTLSRSWSRPLMSTVDCASFATLPPPVARYFRHVLTDGQALIATAELRQSGELRVDTETNRWSHFTARHLIVPAATGFVWNAKVETPLGTHVKVVDSYANGTGSGRVSLMSTVRLAAEAGAPELDSGALHRYLAEAVWCPTALLPECGVAWTPIDDSSARATLTDGATSVSLDFRFNDAGEVAAVYSPGRFARSGGGYTSMPWEGHFRDYREQAGMRIPFQGEVGWYREGTLELVWKGELDEIRYEFGAALPRDSGWQHSCM